MSKITNKYPEIENIKEDISSLKADTIELAKHVKHDGSEKTVKLKEATYQRAHTLAEQSEDKLKDLLEQVKDKPLQSMAIAFAAGLAVSMLTKRR